MLQMIKGASVKNADMLSEAYEISENRIIANVNADKIRNILEHFMKINADKSLFLFIEVPANLKDEHVTGKRHKDIYYLDGLSANALQQLLKPFYEILIHDGLSAFGIGNAAGEEIGKYKYNSIQVFFRKENQYTYIRLFQEEDIPETQSILTAWDTFSEEAPGISTCYTDNAKRNIYDILKTLKEVGLYHAEQREEA